MAARMGRPGTLPPSRRSVLKRLQARNDLTIGTDRIKPANSKSFMGSLVPFVLTAELNRGVTGGMGRVKSREQLITELADLRKQIDEMKRSETDCLFEEGLYRSLERIVPCGHLRAPEREIPVRERARRPLLGLQPQRAHRDGLHEPRSPRSIARGCGKTRSPC